MKCGVCVETRQSASSLRPIQQFFIIQQYFIIFAHNIPKLDMCEIKSLPLIIAQHATQLTQEINPRDQAL